MAAHTAFRLARVARRLTRFRRLCRLHRARRHGDRRGRFGGTKPLRRPRPRRRRDPRRRPRLFAGPARSERQRARISLRDTAPFLASRRCRPWRAPATGERRWSRSKRSTAAYPLLGTVVTDPAMPLPALFARQGDAFGAAADPALLSAARSQARRPHHHRQRGDRTARGVDRRAGQTRRRDRLRTAPPDQRGGAARERAAAARQPGALALPAAPARNRVERSRRGVDRETGAERNFPMPAGISARATRPRRSSNAMSSASANSSPSSP